MLDKTGTPTKEVFAVQAMRIGPGIAATLLPLVAALEAKSTHTIAQAVVAYVLNPTSVDAMGEVKESIPSHRLRATLQLILTGSQTFI